MRTSVKTAVAGSLAALVLSMSVLGSTPASAGGWGWHHHGFGWGPGIAIGVLGLAAAGAYAASEDSSCIRERPVYDRYGYYVGTREVNVCY
jgi:hypothetical protein